MQTTMTISITGPDCEQKKALIMATAKQREKTASKFMVWLFDQFVEKQNEGRAPQRRAPKRGA